MIVAKSQRAVGQRLRFAGLTDRRLLAARQQAHPGVHGILPTRVWRLSPRPAEQRTDADGSLSGCEMR